VTLHREQLSDEPVRLGRRRAREEPDEHDLRVGSSEREMLDARPDPTWHPPRRLVVATLLVALVATAGWYLDRQDQAREARALEGCRRQLHNAVVFADLRLMAMADYLAPTLSATSGARHAQLADLMGRPARSVLRDVERADRVCREVSIRPWHFSLAARHHAATAYSGALAERVRGVAEQGRSYYRETTSLQRLRDAADIHILGGPF
jgi:hypothetical protein